MLDRGLIAEDKFIAEDAQSEMSYAQKSALGTMNSELKSGRLKDADSRRDAKLVRQVMDEAWGLTDEVRGYLTKAFGEDGAKTLRDGASTAGTPIVSPHDFAVRYTERVTDPNKGTVKDTNLAVAIEEWEDASYPSWGSGSELEKKRRSFQIRVQKALHDAQPVVITWDVDFNAMESGEGELQGSF
ncbi:MAG: hypothetical protein HY744_32000, partial [Deltaproteobacteria bacterium]|nr:hypothetical protein [Deltaproteobacteria bacterium]